MWYYSPSCALFYYSLFSWMPDSLGEFLYVFSSWLIFIAGLCSLLKVLYPAAKNPITPFPLVNIFWFLLASEMIGAILNARLEITMIGVVMWASACIIRNKNIVLPLFLAAMVSVWKFLTLPMLALLSVPSLIRDRSIKIGALFIGGIAFWLLLPFAVKPWDYIVEMHRAWLGSISGSLVGQDSGPQANWLNYPQIYSFLKRNLGVVMTYKQAQYFGALCGIGMALWLGLRSKNLDDNREPIILALALGATFLNVFMPTSQSAAYVTYAPLLLAGFIALNEASPTWKKIWIFALGISFAFTSIFYSDLVPHSWKSYLSSQAVKPVGCIILALTLMIYLRRKRLNFEYFVR